MKTKKVIVYCDPGHAWAKVSKKELVKLKIENEISGYSYQRGNFAYLEEDNDLSKFVKANEDNNVKILFKEFFTNRYSKIRNYEGYRI